MSREIEEFAERVRRQAHCIYVAAMTGNSERAAELSSALMSEAATVANQKQMEREASDEDRYDLNSLPAPSADRCLEQDIEEGEG